MMAKMSASSYGARWLTKDDDKKKLILHEFNQTASARFYSKLI